VRYFIAGIELVGLEEDVHFDTRVKEVDLIHETDATFELVVQGNMKDENGTEIPIPLTHKSYKDWVKQKMDKDQAFKIEVEKTILEH